jgi:hypothetical protein
VEYGFLGGGIVGRKFGGREDVCEEGDGVMCWVLEVEIGGLVFVCSLKSGRKGIEECMVEMKRSKGTGSLCLFM